MGMQLAFGFSWSLFLLLPKFLTTELQVSESRLGLISAIPALSAVLAIPAVGRGLDRYGRRPLVIAGALLAAAYAFGFTQVDHVGPLLYVLQVIQGLAFVLEFNAAATLVADTCPPDRLGQAIGLFGASNAGMNGVGPTVGEIMADASGWSAAFRLSGYAALVALAAALWLEESPRTYAAVGAPAAPSHGRTRVWRTTSIITACGAAFGTVFTYYQPFALQLGIADVRNFMIGFMISVITMRVGFGHVADRIGRKRTAVFAMALYGVTILSMTQLAHGMLLAFGLLFGVAHGLFYPAMNALAVQDATPQQRGRVMTYFNGGFHLGFTFSVLCLGWVAEHFGFPIVFALGAACTLGALALLGGLPADPVNRRSERTA